MAKKLTSVEMKREASSDSNAVKKREGEKWGKILLEEKGFLNIGKRKKGEKGFDLKAKKRGKTYKIEVKGTTNPNEIPDMFATEFHKMKLVADYLLVVRLEKGGEGGYTTNGAHLLPKKVVDGYSDGHKIKKTVVVSHQLKKDLKDPFISRKYWIPKKYEYERGKEGLAKNGVKGNHRSDIRNIFSYNHSTCYITIGI